MSVNQGKKKLKQLSVFEFFIKRSCRAVYIEYAKNHKMLE